MKILPLFLLLILVKFGFSKEPLLINFFLQCEAKQVKKGSCKEIDFDGVYSKEEGARGNILSFGESFDSANLLLQVSISTITTKPLFKGKLTGTMTITNIPSNGSSGTITVGFTGDFYQIGKAINFDGIHSR
jgi:hypothetical protein